MATPLVAGREVAPDGDDNHMLSLEASPLGSAGTCSTPDTELSERETHLAKQSILDKDRMWAREKLARLTQEEKVGAALSYVLGKLFRMRCLRLADITAYCCGFLEDKSHSLKGRPCGQNK